MHQVVLCVSDFSQHSASLFNPSAHPPKAPTRSVQRGATQPQPVRNGQSKEVQRLPGYFPLLPQPPSLLIMVIQSRLKVQTFSFNEVPGSLSGIVCLLPIHSCKMMALTFPILLENGISAPQFIVMSQISFL